MQLTTITDETRLAWANLADRATGIVTPSVRLGVTGLARAGKTVFIAALVHNLVHGGRLPLFKAYAGGRVAGARLEPQPDDAVPRFDYERHVRALVEERLWPDSTRQISELRLTVDYELASLLTRALSSGRLNIDIVDYPGEWLLDLPLLSKSYTEWSRDSLAAATPRRPSRPRRGMAEAAGRSRPACARRRGAGARAGRRLHRLSHRLPRRQPPALHPAAGAFPDARRPRQFAGADLRAAPPRKRRRGSARLARPHDGPPLPGLSQCRGAPLLPRSLRPPRPADRDGRRADRAQRRAGRHRRSRSRTCRHPRLLPARAHQLAERIGEPAHRPHSLRRHQGRPASPRRPRPSGGDPRPAGGAAPPSAPASPAPASRCWRWPRCAPPARRP